MYNAYADFESVLEKTTNTNQCQLCNSKEDQSTDCRHSFTVPLQNHRPICVSFIVVDREGQLLHEFNYTGDDVVEKFIQNVLRCEKTLLELTKMKKYMIITSKEQDEFNSTDVCYICNNNQEFAGKDYKPFTPEDRKNRDHCHITG